MAKISKMAKVLTFYPSKCKGCYECEKACSQVHFKTDEGGEKSAIRILKEKNSFKMSVCDQRGLCLDMCPVGALTRKKNGVVWLDKNTCIGCQACVGFCPIQAMRKSDARIEPFKCISCGSCVRACPEHALELVEVKIPDIKQVVYHGLDGGH
ncbi:MAG: 4Fe-4S binding protein [Candidatus Thermoplasmatota archaeon]|nr:4Fe-4S binding protein [Candidatus Thermoplasmatota archaeon]